MSKSVETTIDVHATPEDIWNVLMDFERYPEWNPFVTHISGEAKLGGKLEITVLPPGGKPMHFKPKVVELEPNTAFAWLGSVGFRGLFDGRHHFRLVPIDANTTRFEHGERFSGLLSVLFGRKQLENTRRGFEAMNEKLKLRVEVAKPL